MNVQPVRHERSKDEQQRSLVTVSTLAADLAGAGVVPGDVLCAHVSLSRLGFVCGAAQAVIEGLSAALGHAGTLIMPSFSGELSDPAEWRFPPVPTDWIDPIREETPAYDARLTPTRQMGVCAELFRNYPDVMRSPHPHSSFAARGKHAALLVGAHPLDFRFGPRSPLGRLAALDGKVLLLGAGLERSSFIYLSQHMAGFGAEIEKSAPVMTDGRRGWIRYRDIAVDNRFVRSGMDFLLRERIAKRFPVGDAEAVLFPTREALSRLLDWSWRDAGAPVRPDREPTRLPQNWSEWL